MSCSSPSPCAAAVCCSDDLFAFIIKMPTMHRMSCFRDDIVFAVFLYQRYVYKVDMKRVNEFGHRGENEGGKTEGEADKVTDGDAKGTKAGARQTRQRKAKKTD